MKAADLTPYGIAIPESYQSMQSRGLLSYGKDRTDWKENWKRILVQAPPALSGCDIEWLSAEELVRRAERYGGRPRWRREWPEHFVFVAFASTGAGDEWGWAPSLRMDSAETPIVYIEHDSDEARIAAPSFAGFLFRMALAALAHCPHDRKEMPLRERIGMLRKSTTRVLDYVPNEMRVVLEKVSSRPFRKVITRSLRERDGRFFRGAEDVYLSIVSEQWANDIVRRTLGYDRLDEAIRFGR